MPLSPRLYTFACACFVANGAAIFGYDLGIIAYVTAASNFLTTTGLTDLTTTQNANYLGFIVSSLLLGAAVGSIPAAYVADMYGRRLALTVAGVIFLVGGSIQTATQNKEMMMAGRFIGGFAIGQLGVLVPLYQSEIANPAVRGRMTATFQFFLGIGAFVAGWIGYGTSKGAPGTALEWRLPLAFQMLPALPLVFLTFILPESPRWLILKGRHEEALVNLARLHSRGNINDALVQGEYQAMRMQTQMEASLDQSWRLIFGDMVNLRKVFYGIVLQFSVQMTGVSAIQYYANDVYTSVGFAKNALLINSINNVIGLVGEATCIAFLDKIGRRPPLIFGNIVSGLTFAVATAMAKQFAPGGGGGTRGQGICFVAMIYIYNFTFSACIGPLSWVYPVEIMQNNIRAKATGITTTGSWLANFMIGQVSPIAFRNIGWKYYLVFTVCSFTNALFFYLFFPETKGRTLEEMDYRFRNMNVIVPLAKEEKVSAEDRERRLANGDLGVKHEEGFIEDTQHHA